MSSWRSALGTRRAVTVSVASFATLTLIPWAFEASRTQRVVMVAGAVPIALVLGMIAGWAPPPSPTLRSPDAPSAPQPRPEDVDRRSPGAAAPPPGVVDAGHERGHP